MYISYEYYRIFYHVARCGNLTKAAEALQNSQPNLTRAIRNLEAEIGCPLFSRTNRGMILTPEGEELVLEINSGGGNVFAGSEIYSVLRSSGVHTVAEVQSLAASAASYLCLGCDEVQISPVAQMMIHLPSTYTEGNRTAHMQSIQLLDSTREAMLNAYELKAGGKADRAEFRRMIAAEIYAESREEE